jgi:hypothetical protein
LSLGSYDRGNERPGGEFPGALAMVRRAQPFPTFPSDVKQSSMSFSAPVAFYIR